MFALRSGETRGLYILRWLARALSVCSIAFILLFVFGENWDVSAVTWEDAGLLLLFPLGFLSGLILGWQEELKGGALAVGSIAALYLVFALRSSLPHGWWFLILTVPGVLFLLYGLLRVRGGGEAGQVSRL